MRILHVVKNKQDTLALSMAKEQASADNDVSVLLLHDAVLIGSEGGLSGLEVFACRDDVLARGVDMQRRLVDYAEIVNLIFDVEKVVCW